jgi:hypothetical protein
VARAEGLKKGQSNWVAYSTMWSVGGPIIEREKIKLEPVYRLKGGAFVEWSAKALVYVFAMEGETALIAAMRCYVASKFGEEVDDSKTHNL